MDKEGRALRCDITATGSFCLEMRFCETFLSCCLGYQFSSDGKPTRPAAGIVKPISYPGSFNPRCIVHAIGFLYCRVSCHFVFALQAVYNKLHYISHCANHRKNNRKMPAGCQFLFLNSDPAEMQKSCILSSVSMPFDSFVGPGPLLEV